MYRVEDFETWENSKKTEKCFIKTKKGEYPPTHFPIACSNHKDTVLSLKLVMFNYSFSVELADLCCRLAKENWENLTLVVVCLPLRIGHAIMSILPLNTIFRITRNSGHFAPFFLGF